MESSPKMPSLQSLALFDSCATLLDTAPWYMTVDRLIETMDRYEITEALVHESNARMNHPRRDSNQRLLTLIGGHPRLHPCWIIDPPRPPGRHAAAVLVEEILEAGVRTVRLLMHQVPPMLWLWEELCAVLEGHRVPCFLDFGKETTTGDLDDADVNGIRDIAMAFPNLPLVLSHIMGGLGVHPAVAPLMHRVQNLHIDVTGILEYWREAARDLGPKRVFFASGLPFTDPGITISNIQYGNDLDEKAKRLMCGGNLRRLMEAVR